MIPVGNTPLIKINRLSEPGCAEIYVKYEGGNPTGSMKDRMALSMIEGAERRGQLKPGGTVVEYTGGSTGSYQDCGIQSKRECRKSDVQKEKSLNPAFLLKPKQNLLLYPELTTLFSLMLLIIFGRVNLM